MLKDRISREADSRFQTSLDHNKLATQSAAVRYEMQWKSDAIAEYRAKIHDLTSRIANARPCQTPLCLFRIRSR